VFECARSYSYSQNFHVHTSHIQLHNGIEMLEASVHTLHLQASGEVEPRRTRPLRPVHRISGKQCIALFERDLCASEALGLYMLSARADAFTTGAWHPRSM
jgi:hypothetical protein